MLLMAFIWIVRSNISSIVVLEGEYLSLCDYCLVLTFSSVALMLFFTPFFILGRVPLILTQTIVFMIVSAFDYLLCRCLLILRSTLIVHHESQFGGQYLLGQSLIYAFQSLPQLFEHDTGCTLWFHSIGSFWNPLFATRKVWVYNLQSDTIFECTTYLRPPDLCQVCPMFPKRAPKTQAFSGDPGAGSPKKLFGFLLLKIPFPELPSYSDGILARFQLGKCFYF